MGESADGYDGTAIGGGNIRVHKAAVDTDPVMATGWAGEPARPWPQYGSDNRKPGFLESQFLRPTSEGVKSLFESALAEGMSVLYNDFGVTGATWAVAIGGGYGDR
jgi:hypothetical protein